MGYAKGEAESALPHRDPECTRCPNRGASLRLREPFVSVVHRIAFGACSLQRPGARRYHRAHAVAFELPRPTTSATLESIGHDSSIAPALCADAWFRWSAFSR